MEFDGKRPMYAQIGDVLRHELDTIYEPGDYLPPEIQLAARFNVNRHTMRRAMDELVREGRLVRYRGRGTLVVEPKPNYALFHSNAAASAAESRRATVIPAFQYLPEDVSPSDVRHVLGLISDTHAPARSDGAPPIVFDLFKGVDLILHAGDVGELWVLDQLSTLAPVVAVHGNDEVRHTAEQLPYQQIVTVNGVRILLWHSHLPIREEEMAFREQDDTWERIIYRSADRAVAAETSVVIYGHTHVPMHKVVERDGRAITVINPGAIAPGRFLTRQRQTVAFLYILENGSMACAHVELKRSEAALEIKHDWAAGFLAGSRQFEQPFSDIPVMRRLGELRPQLEDVGGIIAAYREIVKPYWDWEKDWLSHAELIDGFEKSTLMTPNDQQLVIDFLTPHLTL